MPLRGAQGARRLHHLAVAHPQHQAADQTRVPGPARDADRHQDWHHPAAELDHQDEIEKIRRKRKHEIDHAHDHHVGHPAAQARPQAQDRADHKAHQGGAKRDLQRVLHAPEDLAQHVVAKTVGPKRMQRRGRLVRRQEVRRRIVVRRDPGPNDANEQEDGDPDQPGHRQLILAVPLPGQRQLRVASWRLDRTGRYRGHLHGPTSLLKSG